MKLLMMELSPVSHYPPPSNIPFSKHCQLSISYRMTHEISHPLYATTAQRRRGIAPLILNLDTGRMRVRSFTLRPLYIHTYCIGGWVDSRDGLGVLEEKISGS